MQASTGTASSPDRDAASPAKLDKKITQTKSGTKQSQQNANKNTFNNCGLTRENIEGCEHFMTDYILKNCLRNFEFKYQNSVGTETKFKDDLFAHFKTIC